MTHLFSMPLSAELPETAVPLDVVVVVRAFDSQGELRLWSTVSEGTTVKNARMMLRATLAKLVDGLPESETTG